MRRTPPIWLTLTFLLYLFVWAVIASPILYIAFDAPWMVSDWTHDRLFSIGLVSYYWIIAAVMWKFAVHIARRMTSGVKRARPVRRR